MLKTVKAFFIISLIHLACCSNIEIGEPPPPALDPKEKEMAKYKVKPEEGKSLVDGLLDNVLPDNQGSAGGIGVNTYLWRATLETLSFMPLSSADPFGGVIVTDWYSKNEAPNEKYKIVAYIIGTQLRVDALKINVFKKIKNEDGDWIDQEPHSEMSLNIENSILTKAKQYRMANIEEE